MKKILSITIISTILLNSCGSEIVEEKTKIEGKSVKIQEIKKDFFNEQIKLIGKVSPIIETPVSSMTAGVIKSIDTEVGKKVKLGQILAKLDLSNSTYGTSFNNASTAYTNSLNSLNYTEESIKNDLESARIQLENAKITKENTYKTTEKQIELAKTQVENIDKNLSNTENTTKETLKNYELLLTNAKSNLENFEKNSQETIKSLQDKKNGLYENIKITLDGAIISIDGAITQADMILGVSDKNKDANNSYEIYLGAKDAVVKNNSENQLRELFVEYKKIVLLDINNNNESVNNIDKISNVLSKIIDLYDNLTLTLDNSITSSNFSQTQIDGYKAIVTGKQSTILGIKTSVTTLKNTLTDLINTISSTNTSIDSQKVSLNNALNIAEASLNNIKAGNTSQIDNISGNKELTKTQYDTTLVSVNQARDSADNAVKIAQATFDSVQAKLNAQRISVKSAVDQAKGGKELAGIQLNNTSITSPFSGIITGRNVEVGTMVGAGTPVFTIGDDSNFKIKVDINSDNITYLKLGQSVKVSKKENTYTGVITLLSPGADQTTKQFKVEISFEKKPNTFNIGDFVDVYINKEKQDKKVLQVPFSSVVSMGQGEYSVFVVEKSKAKSKNIKIGEQNSEYIEIIDGLKEGEKVIISGTLNISDGDLLEIDN